MSTIKLTPLLNEIMIRSIIESMGGDANKIEKKAEDLEQELEKAGMDADKEEVQAAMLNALIDADGDANQLDVSDVESIAKNIKESRSASLNESGSWIVKFFEGVFGVLGNAALLNTIAEKVEQVTGKKIDTNKLKSRIDWVAGWVKKITGFPAKAMERTFQWLAKKFSGGLFAQKIAGYSGTLIAVLGMFIFGVIYFPSVSSIFFFIFSVAGLLGKGAEMYKMIKEIIHAVKEEMEKNKGTDTAAAT